MRDTAYPGQRRTTDPFESAHDTICLHARDWAADSRDAWLWGIIVGWEDGEDESALLDVAAKHGWPAAEVDRLRDLRASFREAHSEWLAKAIRSMFGGMPALPSVREAMRDAGVPGWEPGSGVSSADAIRWLAQQRDDLARKLAETRETEDVEVTAALFGAIARAQAQADETGEPVRAYVTLVSPDPAFPDEIHGQRIPAGWGLPRDRKWRILVRPDGTEEAVECP